MRYHEIDGIRGFAALAVLFCHMIVTPFGHLEPILNPGFLLINGTLAVQIFFVLSGDALSARFFATGDTHVVDRLLIKRYFRLTFLIFISSLCIFALKFFDLDFHLVAARQTNNELLAAYLPQAPDFDAMLNYALAGVYVNYPFNSDADFYASLPTAYNPVFWSMALELSGSLLIFLFLYAYPRLKNPHSILLFLCGCSFLLFTSYAGFFLGLYFGYCRHQGKLDSWQNSKRWQHISMLILIGLTAVSGLLFSHLGRGAIVLLAALFVFLFYTNNAFLRLFRGPFARWLGALSFPLYAIHFAVLISATSVMIVWSVDHGGLTPLRMAAISSSSIVLSLMLAFLVQRIEAPYLRFIDKIATFALKR